MSFPATFYHATAAANLEGVTERGLAAGSCITDDADIAAYYAEGIEEEGERAVILEISGALLLERLGEDAFEIDGPSIAEPITSALGRSADEIISAWRAVPGDGTWRDSLEIVRSIRVMRTIPAAAITAPSPPLAP